MSFVDQVTLLAARLGAEVKATRASIGSLSSLATTSKTSLVGAVNELFSRATSASTLTLLNSGDNSELVTSIPIATSAGTAVKTVVFSMLISDLAVGDQLIVNADFQVTLPTSLTYNALISSTIILGETPTTTVGTEISEANGTNITPALHHLTTPRPGSITVASTSRKYVNVVAYSASASANAAGTDALTVDQDYGRLIVQRFRTVTNVAGDSLISGKANLADVGDPSTDFVAMFNAGLL